MTRFLAFDMELLTNCMYCVCVQQRLWGDMFEQARNFATGLCDKTQNLMALWSYVCGAKSTRGPVGKCLKVA